RTERFFSARSKSGCRKRKPPWTKRSPREKKKGFARVTPWDEREKNDEGDRRNRSGGGGFAFTGDCRMQRLFADRAGACGHCHQPGGQQQRRAGYAGKDRVGVLQPVYGNGDRVS